MAENALGLGVDEEPDIVDLGWDEEEEAREEVAAPPFARARCREAPEAAATTASAGTAAATAAETAAESHPRPPAWTPASTTWNPTTLSPMTPSPMRIPPNRMSWNLTKLRTKTASDQDDPADGGNDDDEPLRATGQLARHD